MNTKLLALTLMVLLIGFGLGLGFSYLLPHDRQQVTDQKAGVNEERGGQEEQSQWLYEKLEYAAAYVVSSGGGWEVNLNVKNTGNAVALVSDILINGVSMDSFSPKVTIIRICVDGVELPQKVLPVSVSPGSSIAITLSMVKGAKSPHGWLMVPGVCLEITLVTAAGYEYPKAIVLP